MGEGLQIFYIVLFAVVAMVLAFWLRTMLGRRTGHEQIRDPFTRKPGAPRSGPAGPAGNVAPFPGAGQADKVINGTATPVTEPITAARTGLQKLKAADRSFDEQIFVRGARGAFEIIVNAFAAGDTPALKPLLSDEVYRSFAEAIAQRQAAKETHETTLVTIKSCELVETDLDGTTASATVKVVSDQINVTRAADGTVVDGAPDRIVEKTDFWTFARDIRSRDPNWQLIATRSP